MAAGRFDDFHRETSNNALGITCIKESPALSPVKANRTTDTNCRATASFNTRLSGRSVERPVAEPERSVGPYRVTVI